MLTDTVVKQLKPQAKQTKHFDGGGLYLLVMPSGGKLWRLKYRFHGKEKLLSLGVYPEVSLKAARSERDESKKLIAADIDPSTRRRQDKAMGVERDRNSFEAVAREWLSIYASSVSPGHCSRTARRLEIDVFPWLGKRPIAEITAGEVLRTVRRVVERDAVETAHRLLVECSMVFRYAVRTDRMPSDPTRDLRGALPQHDRQHFAAITDPSKLGDVLRAFWGYSGAFVVKCALQLLPLVFVRPGELRNARWADIDLEAGEWRYFVTKTKTEHIVPLSRQAVEILRELHPLTGHQDFVFPNARCQKSGISSSTLTTAMRNMGFPYEVVSGHGFRATARTLLDEALGYRPELIEHQLAHNVKDPLGRAYNRTKHLEERREMMQRWADYLDQLRADQKMMAIFRPAAVA